MSEETVTKFRKKPVEMEGREWPDEIFVARYSGLMTFVSSPEEARDNGAACREYVPASRLAGARVEAETFLYQRDQAQEREQRLRAALEEIASRPIPERNPDGEDQAAETMQLLANAALADQEEESRG